MSGLTASETSAVEAAAEEYVRTLFSTLMKSIQSDGPKAVDRFAAGIALVRKGKALALAAPIASPTAEDVQLASATLEDSAPPRVARKSATKTRQLRRV